MGLDYVDIFYSHRVDPTTPLEETMGALDTAVRQGKALYVGVSSYNAKRTREAVAILRDLGTPCLIHQPSYSMLNRWIEEDRLLDTLAEEGVGCICFSPLAQGLLSDKYLSGVPAGSRADSGTPSWRPGFLSDDNLAAIRALNAIAAKRGQTLAEMAIAWVLRDPRVTSALIGASRPAQVASAVKALADTALLRRGARRHRPPRQRRRRQHLATVEQFVRKEQVSACDRAENALFEQATLWGAACPRFDASADSRFCMFFHDENPPHVHVKGPDFAAKLRISNVDLLAGGAPNKTLSAARRWIRAHKGDLIMLWDEFQR